MTHRIKIVLFLVFIVIVLTILRETGIINADYYKMTTKTSMVTNWTKWSIPDSIDSSTEGTKLVNRQLHEFPIVVIEGNDTLYNDNKIKGNYITIKVDNFKNGFLWTPLYKSSKFTAIGTVIFEDEIIKTTSSKISEMKAELEGKLSINGNVSIAGICSHRQAVKLIKELAVNSFVLEVKKYFSTLAK